MNRKKTPIKRHRGEPGRHGTKHGTHGQPNLTTIPTHQRTRATASRPNPRPTQRKLNGRRPAAPEPTAPLAADSEEAAPCEPSPAYVYRYRIQSVNSNFAISTPSRNPKELNIAFIYSAPPRSRTRFFITGRGPRYFFYHPPPQRFPAASLPGKHRARAGYMYSTCTFFTLILFLLTHFAPSFALHVLTQRHIFLAIANTPMPALPPYTLHRPSSAMMRMR